LKRKIHILAATVAILCILTFITSTVLVELFGSTAEISTIKTLIVTPGLFILIPAMAILGITGTKMAGNSKNILIIKKQKRMKLIAANGLFILTPCAIILSQWAQAHTFDSSFYTLQLIELLSGTTNLSLMTINMRDGLKLTEKT